MTGSIFSGAAIFERCNTESPGGGAKAPGTGNSGVLYNSFHNNACVWRLPEPPPPGVPVVYNRKVWDVFHGLPDDPPCTPAYQEVKDVSPHY